MELGYSKYESSDNGMIFIYSNLFNIPAGTYYLSSNELNNTTKEAVLMYNYEPKVSDLNKKSVSLFRILDIVTIGK